MKNPLKEKIQKGQPVVGAFVGLGHPDVTEILSRAGFDWLLIDGEHGPLGLETMQTMLMAMNGSSCTPIIRVEWNDPVIIKRVLDIGAYGVLIPWVNSKEEAEAAVQACKYPPEGIRGWGPRRAERFDPDYRATANDEVLISVQIETQKAVDNLDEIASVEGIDALFIGPYDLSNNMGFGIPPQWDNPRFLGAIEAVIHVCEQYGKAPGLYANKDNIKWAVEKGFVYNTVGEADEFLTYGAEQSLKKARGG
jgi:2-keto-3-deoxy-L-rhamnonate aldolase RhmA